MPFDLQAAALDSEVPSNSFDGTGGSLSLGSGWAPAEGNGRPGDPWRAVAWANKHEASLDFVYPREAALDFFGACAPFEGPGVPRQVVTLELGTWTGPPIQMRSGWQDIRVPLPNQPALAGRVATLRLHFANLSSPSKSGGSGDPRSLAAVFNFVAVVPHRVISPREFVDSAALDPAKRSLTLPAGGTYSLPVPGASRIDLRLGDLRSDCPDCAVGLEFSSPGGGAQQRWTDRPKQAANRSFTFRNQGPRPAYIRLKAIPGAGDAPDPRRTIRFSLPSDFVRIHSLSSRSSPQRQPNVFVYLIDTLRADGLSLYGARRPTSPRIDEFARDSVSYLHAGAPSAWTLSSTASLLTGVFAFRHGLMNGERKHYARDVPVLASALREGGYATVGISHSFLVSPSYGLDEGFETFLWRDELNGRKPLSQEIRRRLVDWLTTTWPRNRPLFAYVHTVDPHSPYSPSGSDLKFAQAAPGTLPDSEYLPHEFMMKGYGSNPKDVAHLRALYEGEIHHADAEFGRFLDLLKFLDLYDDSLIVLTADHGEEFGEHGGFDHGRTLYEELLHVPLVVKFPGDRWKGSTVSSSVSLVDLAPTILDVAGVDRSRLHLDGRNVTPPAAVDPSSRQRILFSEIDVSPGPGLAAVNCKAIRISDLKCIFNVLGTDQFSKSAPTWTVFDLARDPAERSPLSPQSAQYSRSIDILKRWVTAEVKGAPAHDVPAPGDRASEEMIERLRSLGYLR